MAGKKSRLPIIALLLLVAAAAGAAYFLLASKSGGESDDYPRSLISSVKRRDIESKLLLSGEVIPAFQVEVKPEVGGKILSIHVETGQTVKKETSFLQSMIPICSPKRSRRKRKLRALALRSKRTAATTSARRHCLMKSSSARRSTQILKRI